MRDLVCPAHGQRAHHTLYHGTRAALEAGSFIRPDATSGFVWITPSLDAAQWAAELAEGDGPGRIYMVEPTGGAEDATGQPDYEAPPHPAMSWRSRAPLRVAGEVTGWVHYHGTKAALQPGDLIAPGFSSNFRDRALAHVYFARTLDAAMWGAELAAGDGRGRIYVVEPTGPIEDDPNLTNRKFRGNPTRSFRSRHPLRVVRELADWPGHPPEAIQAMKDALARMAREGTAHIED